MTYSEVKVICLDQTLPEILEAELMDMDFESFKIDKSSFSAFILTDKLNSVQVKKVLYAYADLIESTEIITHKHTNWNAVWEANYPSVSLGNELFIGAPFHKAPSEINHSIIIEPNMSFGTGHHPTTEMVLRQMFKLDLKNKKLLDFGCGSGILSIYADLREANGLSIEIDENAAKAARANFNRNRVSSFKVLTGGIEQICREAFDIILANINRNVIEECLPTFLNNLKQDGYFICSGFLVSDIIELSCTLTKSGLVIREENSIGEWGMIAANKPV